MNKEGSPYVSKRDFAFHRLEIFGIQFVDGSVGYQNGAIAALVVLVVL